jgi:hypothetical protein
MIEWIVWQEDTGVKRKILMGLISLRKSGPISGLKAFLFRASRSEIWRLILGLQLLADDGIIERAEESFTKLSGQFGQ